MIDLVGFFIGVVIGAVIAVVAIAFLIINMAMDESSPSNSEGSSMARQVDDATNRINQEE